MMQSLDAILDHDLSIFRHAFVYEVRKLNYVHKSAFYTCFTKEIILKQLFASGSVIMVNITVNYFIWPNTPCAICEHVCIMRVYNNNYI